MFAGIVGAVHESPATHPVGKCFVANIYAENSAFIVAKTQDRADMWNGLIFLVRRSILKERNL